MITKNKKVLLLLIPVFIISLVWSWYLLNKNHNGIDIAPIPNQTATSSLACNSYGPDSCPGDCVVCPPCPECSSISCQSEQFCAGIGIDRTWYEKIKSDLNGSNNSTVCKRENCHGLDIKCGSNPPDFCTEMYALGDKCLRYAECALVGDDCQVKSNSKFDSCKACVDSCSKEYSDDVIKMFECEGKCE